MKPVAAMASRIIDIELVSTYKGDLTKRLRQDQRRLEAYQRMLSRNPLTIPVKLDLSSLKGQAAIIRQAVLGAVASGPAGIVGPNGQPVGTAARKLAAAQGLLSSMTTTTFGKNPAEFLTQVQQIGDGLQRISRFKIDPVTRKSTALSETVKDVRTVKELEDGLRGVNRQLGQTYAAARGRGDKAGQIAALTEQKRRVNDLLSNASTGGLTGSAVFTKAENQLDRISSRIAGLEGRQESAAARKSRQERTREIANQITHEERRVQQELKANKLATDAAERLPDRVAREAEINRLYDERKKLFEGSRDRFRDMDTALQQEGRPDLADRAMRRGLGQQNQANQAELDQARRVTDNLRAQAKEQERIRKENDRAAERSRRLADQALARSGRRNTGRAIRLEEYAVKQAVLRNEADTARARALPDQAAREAELNRLHQQRAAIYSDSAARLRSLQQVQAGAGNVDNAGRAEAAALKATNAASKAAVSQVKDETAAALSARQQATAKLKADRQAAFSRELQDIKAESDKRIAAINQQERREKAAAAKNRDEVAAAARRAHLARQSEYGNRAGQYGGVENRARGAGFESIATTARGGRLRAEVSGARDMEKFAAATARSGHALNFHSSSLLRNAATYVKWMVPVQAVIALTSAFRAGVAGAVRVDRQFATLRSVFRGTDEEAQKLKKSVLDLATAQGRTTEEAMDASIRWSRLGLNRVQVLQATRTSLMAANVAEITAAESAEKLSAIYATYRLNVGDLDVVLGRLNAISNRYNVTNKDLLEGIVRVAGVAKQSGLALRDVEGMIGAVTGATGRPGQEAGNALKFVVTRLAAPETMKALKDNFDIDLTDANGDLKEMSDIFRELAAIFPTLNNSQKQFFLKVTAGSRQSSRMALVMDQYRQSQILAAEAGFDTASAFRENEKILGSVQSSVESLTAAWEKLFVAIGDTGVTSIIAAVLKGAGNTLTWGEEQLGKIEGSIGKAGIIQKFARAQAIRLGESGGSGGYFAIANARDALKGDFLREGNPNIQQPVTEIDQMTAHVDALRERLGALERSSGVFSSMAEAIRAGAIDRESLVRDFESGAHLLLNLQDGAVRYGDAIQRFYTMLDAGDSAGVAKFSAELADLFKGDLATTQQDLDLAIKPVIVQIRARLKELNAERKALLAEKSPTTENGKAERTDRMEKIQSDSKAAQSAIEQLTQAVEKFNTAAYGGTERANISKYLDDIQAQATLIGEAFRDFAPDGDNDPVARIFSRRRHAEMLGRDWLAGIQQQTSKTSDRDKSIAAGAIASIEKDVAGGMLTREQGDQQKQVWQKLIDQADEANLIIANSLKLEDQRLSKLLRELEIKEQIAALQRVQTDASRRAQNSSQVWRFGATESDKDLNQGRGAILRANRSLDSAWSAANNSRKQDDTPAARAAPKGSILQDEATARAALEALERRQYDLDAARKQVAIDTAKAMREQTEEAGKRLMLASREDQLRAAALKRTVTETGPVRANEFYSLSQPTRQAFANYLPDDAPDALNEAKQNGRKALREINDESTRIAGAIGGLRRSLEILERRITAATGKGGMLDTTPSSPRKTIQDAANPNPASRDGSPIVNVDIGNVAVSVQLSKQIEPLLTNYVDRVLTAGLSAMEQRLLRISRPIPNAQGVSE